MRSCLRTRQATSVVAAALRGTELRHDENGGNGNNKSLVHRYVSSMPVMRQMIWILGQGLRLFRDLSTSSNAENWVCRSGVALTSKTQSKSNNKVVRCLRLHMAFAIAQGLSCRKSKGITVRRNISHRKRIDYQSEISRNSETVVCHWYESIPNGKGSSACPEKWIVWY